MYDGTSHEPRGREGLSPIDPVELSSIALFKGSRCWTSRNPGRTRSSLHGGASATEIEPWSSGLHRPLQRRGEMQVEGRVMVDKLCSSSQRLRRCSWENFVRGR